MTAAAPSRPSWIGPLAGGAVGAAFLLALSGLRPLDPTEVGWVMKFDWVPHYFGWYFFRVEPWHWPPGRIEGYYAPFGTAVGLTDAIPLAAYLLKPLAPWLPRHFQYIGPWWLLSFTLQGAFAARLLGRWVAVPHQVLGAALFVLLPTLLARVAHAALCSHWLLLWALLVATREPPRRMRATEWAALGLLAGMIQPYLAAMVLTLLGAVVLAGAPVAWPVRLRALASALAATLLGWWVSGLFNLTEGGALAAEGLGVFSMNLLGFINPAGWSRVLPSWPIAGVGQEVEGFHYLGLGVLALLVAATTLRRRGGREAAAPLWPRPLIAVCLVMTAFAISPRVTLGADVIADLNGAWSAPLALFRSSGRFVWPLTYLLVTWGIVTVARRLPARAATATLALAVGVQLADLHHIHVDRRNATHDPAFYAWEQPFRDDRWPAIARHYRHVVLAPPPQCRPAAVPALAPSIRFAAEHGLTINRGILSRHEEVTRARYCEGLTADLDAGTLADDSLYLVPTDRAPALRAAGRGAVVCGTLDAVTMCSTAAAAAPWRDLLPLD